MSNPPFKSKSNSNEMKNGLKGPNAQPLRPISNTYWVIPNKLIAGEYPSDKSDTEESRRKIRKYLDRGINCFVDLTHERERESYEQILYEEAEKKGVEGVDYKRFSIQDFGVCSHSQMKNILDFIDHAVDEEEKTVYVHCRGGIGRTGTTIGCYLGRHGNTGEEALHEVNRLFKFSGRSYESYNSPETPAQMDMVWKWSE